MGFRLAVVQPMAHRPPDDERNMADVVAQVASASSQGPGTFLIDVDLTRIREMRQQEDGPLSSLECGAKPGVLTHWQRPEMNEQVYPSATRI
jgi:hypothetical protein